MPFPRRKSYTERIEDRRKFFVRAGLFLLVFIGFELVSGLFLKTYAVTSASMSPTVLAGDRLLITPFPYGPLTIFGKIPAIIKPGRGDLVLVRPPFVRKKSVPVIFFDSFVRFVTLQMFAPTSRDDSPALEGPFVVRVIGLPGDQVSMEDFVFKVKPAGSDNDLTEFEFSSKRYDIHKPSLPAGWQKEFPLSGSMAATVLGKAEYFVAADDRESSADSRTWGPLGLGSFDGKVLLFYRPFRRFGSP